MDPRKSWMNAVDSQDAWLKWTMFQSLWLRPFVSGSKSEHSQFSLSSLSKISHTLIFKHTSKYRQSQTYFVLLENRNRDLLKLCEPRAAKLECSSWTLRNEQYWKRILLHIKLRIKTKIWNIIILHWKL